MKCIRFRLKRKKKQSARFYRTYLCFILFPFSGDFNARSSASPAPVSPYFQFTYRKTEFPRISQSQLTIYNRKITKIQIPFQPRAKTAVLETPQHRTSRELPKKKNTTKQSTSHTISINVDSSLHTSGALSK